MRCPWACFGVGHPYVFYYLGAVVAPLRSQDVSQNIRFKSTLSGAPKTQPMIGVREILMEYVCFVVCFSLNMPLAYRFLTHI